MDEEHDAVEPTDVNAAPSDPADEAEIAGIDRRTFLIRAIGAIGGGITAAIGIPAVFYVTGSARAATGGQEWVRLGSVTSVEPGAAPILMKANVEQRTGYLVEEQELSVFVTTDNGAEFTLLSNVCTHLGCRVRWVEDEDSFFCPCHNGIFAEDGTVLSGPPPRPLDHFEYKIEDGQIFFKPVAEEQET
jgi:Rieske Fe-S protein